MLMTVIAVCVESFILFVFSEPQEGACKFKYSFSSFLRAQIMVKKSTTDPLGGYVENAEALLTLLQEDADLLKSSAKGGEKFNKGIWQR